MEKEFKIERDLVKKQIVEQIGEAETAAELEAVRLKIRNKIKETTNAMALKLKEKQDRLKETDRDCEQMLAEAVAARHKEIKEENREKWCSDRERMWEEAANTCTPQTIAAILHTAKERGVIGLYTISFADGAVIDSRWLLESEAQQ